MRSEGYYSRSVCVSVCLSVKSRLTYGASVRPENAVTYSAGNEGQKICGDLPETTAYKSYAAKHERKSQLLIIPTYRCQLSPLDTQRSARGYPTIVNNIQPCPKLCLLMPLARVGARTDSTTRYSYNARRGQLPRTRIGIQWNLSNPDTKGAMLLVLIIEVSSFEGLYI